jgi:hypothetical protein
VLDSARNRLALAQEAFKAGNYRDAALLAGEAQRTADVASKPSPYLVNKRRKLIIFKEVPSE